ncbi:hypothetical protein QJS10_CPB15g02149 [Acorus calamus]|uniref:MI domain-containing protein n=1 Tax=Acorus calamus TaxID=4465 RepID=A0AAV9D8U5_ACOCL|nr:hypothetical protein QJS10_CPB15g02149 [Acorus calamus]
MDQSTEKSRKEKRKESRLAKQKNRFQSWVEHQRSVNQKKAQSIPKKPETPSEEVVKKKKSPLKAMEKKRKRKSKTKFEEYLEMEENKCSVSATADLELEKKLARRLRVKGGRLGGLDDGINMLFDGLPSVLNSSLDGGDLGLCEVSGDDKKRKRRKKSSNASEKEGEGEVVVSTDGAIGQSEESVEETRVGVAEVEKIAKYVPPHLVSRGRDESEEHASIRRRVRGLLNRLSGSNVESITEEISTILQSVGRSVGYQMITEEVLASCSKGPRGNEQYAAVFASFIVGMSCLVGVDFSAKLIASLAKSFEDEYSRDDSLSLRNLTLLLTYLYIFGVCSSDLIYDLLDVLTKRLTELDVSTTLTILDCSGMKLRGDDPSAMKDFILSVQNRVNELKSHSGSTDGKTGINSKRMEFMIETICDIKNNKKRPRQDPIQHTRLKKWLQKLGSGGVLLRGLKWNKLLDPQKKGQWWLSGDIAPVTDNIEVVAGSIDKEVLETQKLLQLAAEQRMNTDIRKAIFCIIMSGEDYIDAFEKILRLDLSGKQDREIMRVLVECCLQERIFNKYYAVLASKLCSHDKNHKFTLQYCLWDHYKELESMEISRSRNLARFVAEMLSSFSLSLSVLKAVDLADPRMLRPKRIMHFRLLFEAIFENTNEQVWNIFTRVAAVPELEALRSNLEFFIKKYVITSSEKSPREKCKLVMKALNNMAGVLM